MTLDDPNRETEAELTLLKKDLDEKEIGKLKLSGELKREDLVKILEIVIKWQVFNIEAILPKTIKDERKPYADNSNPLAHE